MYAIRSYYVLFGVLKTALILSVILLLFDHVDKDVHIISEETKEESQVYEPLKNLVPTLLPFLNFWDADDNETQHRNTDEAKRMV